MPYDNLPKLLITSPAFLNDSLIPIRYTCEGVNMNPPLGIRDYPGETVSFVLIMDDPDTSIGTFVHWVVYDIPPQNSIHENSSPGKEALNGFGKTGYRGPCPPSGMHRYFFKIHALDIEINLPQNSDVKAIEEAMSGHVIAYGELMGRYEKTGGKDLKS